MDRLDEADIKGDEFVEQLFGQILRMEQFFEFEQLVYLLVFEALLQHSQLYIRFASQNHHSPMPESNRWVYLILEFILLPRKQSVSILGRPLTFLLTMRGRGSCFC